MEGDDRDSGHHSAEVMEILIRDAWVGAWLSGTDHHCRRTSLNNAESATKPDPGSVDVEASFSIVMPCVNQFSHVL